MGLAVSSPSAIDYSATRGRRLVSFAGVFGPVGGRDLPLVAKANAPSLPAPQCTPSPPSALLPLTMRRLSMNFARSPPFEHLLPSRPHRDGEGAKADEGALAKATVPSWL